MQFEGEKPPAELQQHFSSSPSVGFKVDSTVNACTKGLWILKKPIYVKDPEDEEEVMPVLIIDTEGLGATDENNTHDTKIFMLALLICSLLIFNSQGTIDESAIGNLSLVVELSKNLKFATNGGDNDSEELAKQFPSFLWVLRDFSLRLIDDQQNQISAKQYLENSLKEKKSNSDKAMEKNRIRA